MWSSYKLQNINTQLTVNIKDRASLAFSVASRVYCQTISVLSSHTREFPRSSPISILLGCDTWPDVAASLTSRVSLLIDSLDCRLQMWMWYWSMGGTTMMYSGYTCLFLSDLLSRWTDKPSCPISLVGSPQRYVVSCWVSGILSGVQITFLPPS